MDDVSVKTLGDWKVQVSHEAVKIQRYGVYTIQDFLNNEWLPCVRGGKYSKIYRGRENWSTRKYNIPSILVRVDMPPMDLGTRSGQEKFPGLYEVECNPSGYGVALLTGVSLRRVAASLNDLGIRKVMYGVAPSRRDQLADLQLFMQDMPLGVLNQQMETMEIDISSFSYDPWIPLWLRAGEEDMPLLKEKGLYSACLLFHQDGGGHKGYLCDIGGAKLLADCNDPFCEFADGFALKPLSGWGSRQVEVWTPLKSYSRSGTTRTRMNRVIEQIQERGKIGEFLAQPFLPPEVHENRFRIWRIYAVWHPSGQYKVMGGVWSERPSLRVHGASDTIEGPIPCGG